MQSGKTRASLMSRNTLSNFVVQGWSLVLALVTTPYIVRGLGADAYGVFGALTVFLGYLSFVDFGFGWGLIKFVAEFHARGDRRAMGAAVATTLVLFAAVGGSAAIVVLITAPWLVRHGLNVPVDLQATAIIALRISAVTFGVNLVASVYGGALRGLQRFEIANAIQAVIGTAQVSLSVVAIAAGYGLVGVCLASLGMSIVAAAALLVAVQRTGAIAVSGPTMEILGSLGRFSGYAALSRVGTQTLYQVEKVFLGVLLPVSVLGYYMVPFNLAFKITGAANSFGLAFFPAMSGLCGARRWAEAAVLLQRAQRFLLLIVLPPVAFVVAAAPQILATWIDADFAGHGSTALRLLIAAFFVNVLCSLDAIALDAAGRPDLTARCVALAGGANIAAAPLLVYAWAAEGAAMALLLSMLVLTVGVWRETAKLGVAPPLRARLAGMLVRPISVVAGPTVLLYLVAPQLVSLWSVIAAGMVFCFGCGGVLVVVALEPADRARLRELLEFVRDGFGATRLVRLRGNA